VRDGLVPGSAVRYNETATRWFIAVVRRVRATEVDIEFLAGDRETVPIEKVEDFLSYLRSRQRTLCLSREDICHAFYGEALTRLRQERADTMKRFLRSHGLRFRASLAYWDGEITYARLRWRNGIAAQRRDATLCVSLRV
jgi:hypothetical protein